MPTSTLRNTPRPALRRLPLALASACLLSAALPGLADNRAPTATALPGGLNVVRGQASVQTQGQKMTVSNSAGAILNWQQFSIGSGASVYFQQPSSVSQVLNRVVGRDPSQILGQLGSNGKVWLLNPQGVLFGRDARIDVAGLVATTLNIRDDDWLAGRYRLTQGDTAGALVNQGTLQADEGGRILLVGGSAGVRNEGLIEAPGGQVLLAAGQSVELVDTHLPHMAVRLDAPAGTALNLGRIAAAGGHVDLMAALVNQDGIVRADALGEGQGGRIVLEAQDRLTLGTGSVTGAGSAGGTGGGLTLSGRQIALLDGAMLDASGATGGGTITVGGGLQGRDPSLRHAEAVWMAPTASIQADATQRGDGGSIVLWSDHATRVYGALSARGGALGGNGGFIETSGGWLDARPAQVRTDAAHGRAGLWLLDPWDITISDTDGDSNIGGGPDFFAIGSSATILTSTIEAALEAGNNVSISTSSSGFEAGDIRMLNATVDVAPTSPVSLTLLADRNIVLDGATLRSQGAALSITLTAANSGAGSILINASTLQTAGGNLLLTGNGTFCNGRFCDGEFGTAALATDSSGLQHGVAIASSLLDAANGRIDVFGQSEVTQADTSGILVADGSSLLGRDINLRGVVVSSGSLNRTGVKIAGGLVAATNSLTINGQAYSSFYSYDGSPTGVDILGEVRLDGSGGTGEGDSLLSIYGYSEDASPGYGYGGPFGVPRVGVGIRGSTGRVVATNGASIDIAGTATGSGSGDDLGVRVDSTAAGAIDTSQGADLSLYSSGNLLISADLRVSEQGGSLALQSDSTLFILGATVTGDPSSVDIVTSSGLQIGSSTQPARLVFGDNTSVHIEAAGFLFGADSFFIPDQGEVFAQQAVDGRVRPLAVLVDTPGSTTLLAAGGPITVFADSLAIGANATFHSPAVGTAVTLAGTADNLHAISLFDNQAGANAISTPNGHWEVWALAPEGEGLFYPGGLVPDFRQVDAVYGQTQPALGGARGFFFQGSAQLTLFLGEGAPPITKVYDGSPSLDADFYGLFVSGFRGQDVIDGALGYNDKNVGTGKSIALNAFGLTGIKGPDGAPVFGYTLDFSAGQGVAAITPATLDLLGAQISDKVYDGAVQAVVQQWNLSGFVPGDDLMVIGDAVFADKNVGAAKPVSLSVLGLSGLDAGNYMLGNVTTGSTTGNLLPAPLNLVTGLVADKVYDGGTAATVLSASVSGVVGSEVLSFALSGSFDDRNAGVGKPASVTLTGFSGADAGNYTLGSTLSVATSATITPATLNLIAATVAHKTYDGGTGATLTGLSLAGAVTGDEVQALGSASFADKNAGSAKPVAVTLSGLGGADAANYQLGIASTSAAADILPAALTLLSATAADKVYDGSTSANPTGLVLGGVVTGDSVLGTGGASFSDRNAGTAKSVTVTLTGFSGADAGNYTLGSGTTATTTAAITPAAVDLLGGSVANKVYDGGTGATVTAWSLAGVLAGDTVNASGSAAFADKNVGTAKPVALVLGGLTGADAGNYTLGNTLTATTTAAITPATLTLVSATAADKVYDGNTSASPTGLVLGGVVTGDSVLGTGGASFSDRNAGTAKSVTVTLTGFSGADAGNYTLGSGTTATTTAAITPATLTLLSATAADKVYDGSTSANPTGLVLGGVVTGDSVLGTGGASFSDRNAGTAKSVTVTLTGFSGADAGNYTLGSTVTATTTAAITPAAVDLLGGSVANKVYDGGTGATVTAWSLAGVLAGDTVNASGSAAFADKNVGTAKPVALVLGGLTGADAGNYLIGTSTAAGSASITPATLNVDGATVANKTYDRTTAATVTGFALAGVVAGDSVAGSGSASFADRLAGVAKPVDVRLTTLTGADAGNYVVGQADASASATIFPAQITLAGGTAAGKTYDGTVNTTATSLTLSGVITGDSVSGSADARFADRNAGNAKPVTLSLLGLSGADAGNYTLGGTLTATTTAAITPALLTYVATPATVSADAPLTGFSGVVTGFVGGDTLASATSGTAVFSPGLEGAPLPGVYALNGSGLTAANYSLTQALGNATALTIIAAPAPPPPPPPPVSGEQAATVVTPTERIASVKPPRDLLPAPLATAPEIGRLLDLMPALDPNNRDAIFGALDISGLGPDRVAAVLAARDEYKKALFSPALARLEQDPSLADAPGCATAQQAASGQCLMVTPLDRESVISNARVVERLPIASPPAVQPAPAAPAVVPPGASAAPAAPAALAAPRPPVPVVVPPFPERRGVRQATLPQIQRKIAVVVGIDQYADARIPRLANSVRDAQAVAQRLETALGYETVVLENPTKAALFRVLNRLTAESSPQDSVVLYYAGHGELVPQTGLGYWQPSDADATRPETWVSNSDINRVLRGIGASQVALVSDSCFSGSLVSETRIRGISPTQDPAALLARRAAVVMSSGGNEPVADAGRNGHSPFAFSLMQALERVPAWRPGSNLFEQVRFQVARQLPQRPQYGASGQGGHEPGADYVFEQRQLEGVTR